MYDEPEPPLPEIGHVVAGPKGRPERLSVRFREADRPLAPQRVAQLVVATEGCHEHDRCRGLAGGALPASAATRPVGGSGPAGRGLAEEGLDRPLSPAPVLVVGRQDEPPSPARNR